MQVRIAGALRAMAATMAVCGSVSVRAASDDFSSLLTLNGNCLKLVALGKDISPYCRPVLSSNTMSVHRVLFHFTLRNDAVLTIVDLPNPTPDTDAIKIERIHLNLGIQGVPPSQASASGKCTFNNPYKGPMTLKCEGRANGKPLIAIFRSDGTPPQ